MIDKSKLKELALAATPEPWDFDTAETPVRIAGGEVVGGDALPYGDVYTMQEYETPDGLEPLVVAQEIGSDNGRFLAAANPAAILELLAENEELTLTLAQRTAEYEEANADRLRLACNRLATTTSTSAPAPSAKQETSEGWREKFDELLSDYAGACSETAVFNVTQKSGMTVRMARPRYNKLVEFVESLAAPSASASPAAPMAETFANLLRIQRAEAETGDPYMVGLYNGMAMMCANVDCDISWEPMKCTPHVAPVAGSQQVPEAWREFLEQWTYDGALQTFNSRELFRSEAARLLAAAAPAVPVPVEQGWISVEDARRPEKAEVVLVAVRYIRYSEDENGRDEHEGYEVTEGEYMPKNDEGGDYFTSFSSPHGDQEWITHWMPLPASPSLQQGKEGAAS